MYNLTISRIKEQIDQNRPVPQEPTFVVQEIELSPPISLEELREILLSFISASEVVVVREERRLEFNNLYEFVDWYAQNRDGFSEPQRVALDTLIQARDGVPRGCNCKYQHRQNLAFSYFETFWTENAKTDMLETIAKISGATFVRVLGFVFPPNTPKTE